MVPVGVAATVKAARTTDGSSGSVDTVIDLAQYSVNTANFTASSGLGLGLVGAAVSTATTADADADVTGGLGLGLGRGLGVGVGARSRLTAALVSSAPAVASQPLTYTITALPAVGGTLRDATGVIAAVPHRLTGSIVYFTATACCTSYTTCTAAQMTRQAAQNVTSFAYTSSDPLQPAAVQVLLGIACPPVAQPPAAIAVISLGAIVALAVVVSCLVLGCVGAGAYYRRNQVLHRAEMRVLAEENEKKVKAAENEALLASKEQEQLRSIMGNVVRVAVLWSRCVW